MELQKLKQILQDYGEDASAISVYELSDPQEDCIVFLPWNSIPYYLSLLTEEKVHKIMFARLGF